jgi:hypothetical protein
VEEKLGHPNAVEAAALRDAAEILALAQADEQDAVEARTEIRARGLPALEPDGELAPLLQPSESLVATRASVAVERHLADGRIESASGRLVLTSRRLLLVGRATISADLADVEELSLAAERLLVTLRDGTGLSFDAGRPRVLRVHVAAAVEAVRAARTPDAPLDSATEAAPNLQLGAEPA